MLNFSYLSQMLRSNGEKTVWVAALPLPLRPASVIQTGGCDRMSRSPWRRNKDSLQVINVIYVKYKFFLKKNIYAADVCDNTSIVYYCH